jgi:two-component system, NarL family, nitrate/nitrite response regulator NarL
MLWPGTKGIGVRNTSEIDVSTGAPAAAPTRVLIVDDHDLFRTGLASLMADEPTIEVVAQASGGRMGVRLAAELNPDVILMDLRMPDLTGPEATREILLHNPEVRVLALTVASEDRDVAEALQAGACGFLAKDTPVDSLIVAIQAASRGTAWLSPRAAEVVLGRIRNTQPSQDHQSSTLEQLSARELDVLRLIANGMENSEIAAELNISPRTAKNHVSNILTKLGLPSRVQAAVYAVRQGVI